MAIVLDEVLALAERFFDAAARGSGTDQAACFLDPHARIHIVQSGDAIGLEDHAKLHRQWTNERHHFGHFTLAALNTAPERARATGTVYWQAEYRDGPRPNVIRAVVGEDWILERIPSGALRFVLYMNTFHHLLPDSAPLRLD